MLKIKLFKSFALLVAIFALLSGFFSIRMINSRIYEEAQTRVNYDLSTAWSVLNSQENEIELILKMAAGKHVVMEACQGQDWQNQELKNRLETIRINQGLDFLGVVDAERKVVLRAAEPHNTGDYLIDNAAVNRALDGKPNVCTMLMSANQLKEEAADLPEQAFLVLEETPRARPTPREVETRGMVMIAAVPIQTGGRICGSIYGGILLNRNFKLVDRVQNIVYQNPEHGDSQQGTVTIFLNDSRIATTVRREDGNRALGTRVSKEVADTVLDNGRPWIGRAFVVNDWYLTAYEPIRDCEGSVIGMLYVGILEEPFRQMGRNIIYRYAGISAFGLLIALVLAFFIAHRVSQPIHRLVEASHRMRRGEHTPEVPRDNACDETESLIDAFNQMTSTLAERQQKLTEANEKLGDANESLKTLNHSYMETLGFVSHELKSPLSAIMNYVFLLKQERVGDLNEKQAKSVKNIDMNVKRIVEMVRHYLNLSRIENRELEPVKTKVAVATEVLEPILEGYEEELANKDMRLDNEIGEDVLLHADLNMTREVFENLISNAIKYGREAGRIQLRSRLVDHSVEFAVGNEGEGIPPEKLENLFQKFSRLEDQKATRKQKGTGLGLFITRHIVEAHGGHIEVESEPNKWTEFRFTLPLYEQEEGRQT